MNTKIPIILSRRKIGFDGKEHVFEWLNANVGDYKEETSKSYIGKGWILTDTLFFYLLLIDDELWKTQFLLTFSEYIDD